VKACAAERGVESSTESKEIGGIYLGHPIHLKAKAKGEKSMSEKQRTWEGIDDDIGINNNPELQFRA
jgi:hypothetical protein